MRKIAVEFLQGMACGLVIAAPFLLSAFGIVKG
jgi:hypothetical protein